MGENASHVADELAVQRLMSAYCQLVDDGRFGDAAALFTDGGVFENRGLRVLRHELVAFLEEVQVPERRGRHSCGYSLVRFDAEDRAHAETDFVFLGRAEGAFFVKFVGRYHDTLQRTPDGWRFVERRVSYVDPEP